MQRRLVHNPVVERGRFQKQRAGHPGRFVKPEIELSKRFGEAVEHHRGKDKCVFFPQDSSQAVRQAIVNADHIHGPDHAVMLELVEILGREVRRDMRRVRPVEQSRRQAVMLRDHQPVPERISGTCLAVPVFLEVPQQTAFQFFELAGQAHQTGLQIPARIGHAAEDERSAKPPVRPVPRIFEQPVIQLVPVANSDAVHIQSG